MSFASLQTPQRPLPGAFLNTPAASRYQSNPPPPRPVFRSQLSSSNVPATAAASSSQPASGLAATAPIESISLLPAQRAAKVINEVLARDGNYPDLDSYVKQGISSDYEIPIPTAWAPYQKLKMYDIPDQIFAQYNHAQVSTMMGLFAELNFAWISIDNALYLWDYTQTNPELLGFEDQPNSITAIKLVVPRAGVFNKNITHLLVVATTQEILTIGVEAKTGPTGVRTVTLFQTGMSLSIRGVDVRVIEGSTATGRIFFGGGGDNEVYELQYQQEEKWFSNKYKKVNHTGAGYSSFVPTMLWGKASPESVRDIAIDDSRNILYTLSSESSIRVFHMDTPTSLKLMLEKKQSECLRDMSHMISQSPLLDQRMRIVSISPISATEAAKLHLMATTSTGCRLFLSATSGYGYLAGKLNPPTNMQVQHIKFPPPDPLDAQPRSPGQMTGFSSMELPILTTSKSLEQTRRGIRFPPGYFLCFASRPPNVAADSLFLSSPDSGRIALQARESAGQGSKYYEQGSWVKLDSRAEDIGLITKPFAASKTPRGFGNELAVQFDEPSTEIAILTNTGIHTIRRRRLVDIFATAIRQGGGDEGLDTEVTKFIRHYGRAETAAAALAVACGQGFDSSPGDGRIAKVMDPSTLEFARKTFIDYGGRPSFSQEPISESPDLELRLSARHEGLSLYMTRLVRSLWKSPVVREVLSENGKAAATLHSTVSASKLRSVQEDMIKLHTFLDRNHTFIEGLAGPDLQRAATKNDELAVQGEHRALNALWLLITSITEGISFALMLFEERMDQIFASLDDTTRQQVRDLTYESLFVSNEGKSLGKVLVKAIVNRNIANGSNVETVADALRRKCKSFCSADDVLIFKAQEQLKKASEHGSGSDLGRNMLNESLRLFERVAENLGYENLETTVGQYIALQFFAGAIQLCLKVASETDRGNRALAWVNDDKPANDSREAFYLKRKRCYDLIHTILEKLDAASSNEPERVDGKLTVFARKRNEAYTIINESSDEVFHYYLYDWYLDNGEAEKLLSIDSPFVITYLQRLANKSVEHADLLWKLYASTQRYYDAATVQLQVAKSDFNLPLKLRIECLSRAKANASCNQIGMGRQAQQVLLHEISELLEVANIQDEILQRLKVDPRIDRARKAQIVQNLDGAVLNLTTLYNNYADQASFFDICLEIYQAADHRNPADISATWVHYLDYTHQTVVDKIASGDPDAPQPYEAIITGVRDLAYRLNLNETTFPPDVLIPMLEKYKVEQQRDIGPSTWVMDLFLEVEIPHETIIPILERMLYNNEAPFSGRNCSYIANDAFYVIEKWYAHCIRRNTPLFGGVDNARGMVQFLTMLTENGLAQEKKHDALDLRQRIEAQVRR